MSSLQEEVCFSELTTQRRCITEAQPPYRIVHVNAAWCGTTGYSRESALGLTPQVLAGPETCSQTLQVLYETLAAACPILIRLLSYRRDSTTFVSDLSVAPIIGQGLEAATHFLWHFGEPQPHIPALVGRPASLAGRHAPGLPGMCGHAALHPGFCDGISAAAMMSCVQPVGGWRPPSHIVDGGAPGCFRPSGRAPASSSAQVPKISLPARLNEALQREVPYPQLVTERAPPHKIIHTNAAWRRLTGHGADELVGKPFEALLSMHDPGLQQLLWRAFSSGQQVTSLATLRKRTGEWLRSPLTASPLLDSSGTEVNWFLHVLHAPTVFPSADGSPFALIDPYMATCCPTLDWPGLHDALGSAPACCLALSSGGMLSAKGGPSGMAMPCRTNRAHIELSALSELQGSLSGESAPGMASQESLHILQNPRQLQWATAMSTLAGSNFGSPDLTSQLSSSAGHGVARDMSVMSALSTSPPSDGSEEAGASGSASGLNGSEAERAADALLAAEPMPNMVAPSATDANSSIAPRAALVAPLEPSAAASTSTQPADGVKYGGAQSASLDCGLRSSLKVRLLTHPTSKALHETSSVSSSSSLGNAGRSGETGSGNGAGKLDEGSVGSEGREPTSPAHESADTLLRAAAHAAAFCVPSKCGASIGDTSSIAGSRTSAAPVRVAPFLTKLYTIVDDPELDEYATWCRNGSALRIVSPQRFADHCLPRFFKHNKLGSFQQQLLTYGFSRIPNDSCLDRSSVWAHPHFRQHASAELEKILRAATSGGKRTASKAGTGFEDEEATAEEELEKMQKHLARLTQSVHGLHEELRSVRSVEMQALDQLVDRIQKRFKRDGSDSSDSSVATCATERLGQGSCFSSISGCGEMSLRKDSTSSSGLDAGSNGSRSVGSNNNDDGSSGGSPGSE